MKKGRHRRFEEARALKQAFELGMEEGSSLMEAPFDPDGDELVVRTVPGIDPSDLNLVLWLDEQPSARVQAAVDEAADEWLDEATSGPQFVYDMQAMSSGQSTDGRHFVWWWVDLGKAPRSVLAGLVERFEALRSKGMPLVALQVGGGPPEGAKTG